MSNWTDEMNMEEVTRMRTIRPEIRLVIMVTLLKAVRTQEGISDFCDETGKKPPNQTPHL